MADLENEPPPPNQRLKNNNSGREEKKQDGSLVAPWKYKPSVDIIQPGPNTRDRPFQGACCRKCLPTSRSLYDGDPLKTLGLANILRVSTQNRDRGLFTRAFHYIAFVMSRRVDTTYPDVSQRVLQSDQVEKAVKMTVEEEMQKQTEVIENSKMRIGDDDEGEDCDLLESERSSQIASKLIEKQSRRAKQLLVKMKSGISGILLRIAGWVLYKLLSKMLNTVQFHKGQIELLKQTRDSSRKPIIYLPMHRSHLDYILVSFILYMNNLKPPLVAAGDNLLIPFFGNLMRGLGAFFIKRRLDPVSGQKDHLYRAILRSYMSENLKDGQSLEFFLEGGRSRTGKACLPKSGLLSVVVDSVLEGVVDDVFIVPVSISYEKLIDDNFITEQIGKPKQPESFTLAAKAIWRTLRSNYGSVRVDFAQPFSLKEYLHSCQSLSKSRAIASATNGPCAACAPRNGSMVRAIPSSASLYGLDVVVSEEKRATIQELAEHVIYDGFNTQALMCTQLVAFLLTTRYREGVSLHDLTAAMDWLRNELLSIRRRDIGFTGESCDAIRYACHLLGPKLITVESIEVPYSNASSKQHMMNGNRSIFLANGYHSTPSRDALRINEHENVVSEFENKMRIPFLKPCITFPSTLELQYYSNSVTSAFVCDSVVANSVIALLHNGLNSIEKMKLSKGAPGGDTARNYDKRQQEFLTQKQRDVAQQSYTLVSRESVPREALVEQSVRLAKLLQYEFLFAPPCTSISTVMADTIDNFLLVDLFHTVKKTSRRSHFDMEDDEDDIDDGYIGNRQTTFTEEHIHVGLDQQSKEGLQFYRSIVSPYIESIWLAAVCLERILLDRPPSPTPITMKEKAFINKLLDKAREELKNDSILYEESVAAETLKNALKLFENERIIRYESTASGRLISLGDQYKTKSALDAFVDTIQIYRK